MAASLSGADRSPPSSKRKAEISVSELCRRERLHLALSQAKAEPRQGISYELPNPSPSPKQSALRTLSLTHAGSYRPVSAYSHARFNAIGLPSWESLPAWEHDLGSDEWLTPDRGSPAARIGGHPIDRLINLGLDNATADGKRGRYSTGVRAWHAFVEDDLGLSPARPMETYAPLYARLQEELLAMRFVCALIEVRGVEVNTAARYFSQVQGWHTREHGVKLAAGIKMERLPQMLRGLRRALGQTPPKERRGIAPQALRRAFDLCLDPDNPNHANIRAALACALQGLLRVGEFTSKPGQKWKSANQVSRADIAELTDKQLVLKIHQLKAGNGVPLSGKNAVLVIGAGAEFIDAVWEVRNMLRVDPIADGVNPGLVPLFRVAGTREPLRSDFIREETKRLMRAIGEDPTVFNTHSYRIGGATALFAAGADMTVIKTMGRWASDIYQLYVRACMERCCHWTRLAGSTRVTDVAKTIDEVDDY